MRWWNVVVTVAFCHGCLRDDLVRCGERYCPTTSTCMAGRCIDPQQLVACDGVAEGDGCVVLDTAGTCIGGLCEIAGRCGDGFMDSGEVCDDGNQADGDGCSRTCASDETCGNGVLDLAETCDCGSDTATQPLGCPTTNSDELTALCDTACTRRCGDGFVTGLEACDGTSVPATCTDFGFYSGTVTCSPFCSFVRDCSGECGDAIVQTSEGEVCDGDASITSACIEFGRDFGLLGCNQFCNPDVGTDCNFYDWSVIATTDQIDDLQANDHGYVLNNVGGITVEYDGTLSQVQRPVTTRVFATSDTFLIEPANGSAGKLEFERFDPATQGWTLLDIDVQVTGGYAAIGDGAYLWVLDNGSCDVTKIDVAAVTTLKIPGGAVSDCISFDVLAGRVVIATSDKIYWYDGAWKDIPRAVDEVRWFGTHVAALANGERHVFDLETGEEVPSTPLGDVTHLVTTLGGNDVARTSSTAFIAHVGYLEGFIATPSDLTRATRDGSGRVIAWGAKVAMRLEAAWTLPGSSRSFSEQPNRTIVHFSNTTVGDGAWPGGFGVPSSAVGEPSKPTFVATSTGLYAYDTGTSSYALVLAGTSQIVASQTETWAIVATTPRLYSGSTWDVKTLPSGCTSAVDLAATAERVLVLMNCPSAFGSRRVYEYRLGAWTQIGPLITGDNLVLAREDGAVFVVTGSAFRRLDNNQTSWSTVNVGIETASFTARNANEVYYQRMQDNSLYVWNGTRSIPFRTLSPLQTTTQQALALDAGLYVKTSQGNAVLAWFGPKPTGL